MKMKYTEQFKDFIKQYDYPSLVCVNYSEVHKIYKYEDDENEYKIYEAEDELKDIFPDEPFQDDEQMEKIADEMSKVYVFLVFQDNEVKLIDIEESKITANLYSNKDNYILKFKTKKIKDIYIKPREYQIHYYDVIFYKDNKKDMDNFNLLKQQRFIYAYLYDKKIGYEGEVKIYIHNLHLKR